MACDGPRSIGQYNHVQPPIIASQQACEHCSIEPMEVNTSHVQWPCGNSMKVHYARIWTGCVDDSSKACTCSPHASEANKNGRHSMLLTPYLSHIRREKSHQVVESHGKSHQGRRITMAQPVSPIIIHIPKSGRSIAHSRENDRYFAEKVHICREF